MKPFVHVEGLTVDYSPRGGILSRRREPNTAVSDVDITIDRGGSLGLVGESGCGKSTLARTLVGLVAPTAGTVEINGLQVPARAASDRIKQRRSTQMIFQDPHASLHPRMRVWRNVAEAWAANPGLVDRPDWQRAAAELLESVGITADMARRYPRELSGGQRQRVAIARALAVEPQLLICDEPTSALDVSVQAQIINLLKDISEERDLTILFISHDLAVVRQIADRTAVMYDGRIVEQGETDQVFRHPGHPYTAMLLAASASLSASEVSDKAAQTIGSSEVADGCPFRFRCPRAEVPCREITPQLRALPTGTQAACHFPIA